MRDFRFWRGRKAEDDDLDRELEAHLELATDERVEAGLPLRDAQLAARREFGSVALTKEELRDMRTGLALAIGANASIFAVVYRVAEPTAIWKFGSARCAGIQHARPQRSKDLFHPFAALLPVSRSSAHA